MEPFIAFLMDAFIVESTFHSSLNNETQWNIYVYCHLKRKHTCSFLQKFLQLLSSRNTLFNLSNFLDKTGSHGQFSDKLLSPFKFSSLRVGLLVLLTFVFESMLWKVSPGTNAAGGWQYKAAAVSPPVPALIKAVSMVINVVNPGDKH